MRDICTPVKNELLNAALAYAQMGWPVFPCHPTKHTPLDPTTDQQGRGGFYLATTDEETINVWWSWQPEAAIALRTGEPAGVFVMDIDPRHGGDVFLDELEARYGALPDTLEVQTGGGGRHIYFNWPGHPVKCSTGQIASGIDIKGDGGYVILPPSDHKSGNTYSWLFEHEPGECPLAQAPAWLLDLMGNEQPDQATALPSGPAGAGVSTISQGQRNNTLASLAGHMRQVGMGVEEIKAALLTTNISRCQPPLDVKEVEQIARSVSRYDPDTSRQAWVEHWPEQYLAQGQTDDWPDLQTIPDDLPPVKVFDPKLLPSTLRPWITDIAERMQCPLDFPAVTSMLGLSGILGRKIAIRPKQLDNWTVYPNLWGMLIGRPSLMKSPPMKETLLPIRRMTVDALAKYESAMAQYLIASDLQSIQTKVVRNNIAAAMKAGEDAQAPQEELAALVPVQEPRRKRYTVNDATVEALGEILAANPNGLIIERDELIGLLKSLERPGQEGARAFYLEGWSGDGTGETDRIGRGNVRIDGLCLSILGTIQPGPLGTFLGASSHESVGGRWLGQVSKFVI